MLINSKQFIIVCQHFFMDDVVFCSLKEDYNRKKLPSNFTVKKELN